MVDIIAWCWEGDKVAYGRLLQGGVVITSGRFKHSDVDDLVNRPVPAGLFTFQEEIPENLGLQRDDGKGDECSAFNDFKFPPIFPPPPPACESHWSFAELKVKTSASVGVSVTSGFFPPGSLKVISGIIYLINVLLNIFSILFHTVKSPYNG